MFFLYALLQARFLSFSFSDFIAYFCILYIMALVILSLIYNKKFENNLYIPPDVYDDYTLEEKMKQEAYPFKQLWAGLNTQEKSKWKVHYFTSLIFFKKIVFSSIIVVVDDFVYQVWSLIALNSIFSLLLLLIRPYTQKRDNFRVIIQESILSYSIYLFLPLQNQNDILSEPQRQIHSNNIINVFILLILFLDLYVLIEIFFPWLLHAYYYITKRKAK
jgi:hypothetical protein